jgi:hypothetical protein
MVGGIPVYKYLQETGGLNYLADAPVITLNGFTPYPGVEPELWERYTRWDTEVYGPLLMQYPARRGIDYYQIIKENPVYPFWIDLHHHETLASQQNTRGIPEQIAVSNDAHSWQERHVVDFFGSVIYRLVRGFRSEQKPPGAQPDTRIKNATIMHLEACRLSAEHRDKYVNWFTEYGMNIFIPLFLQQTGIKGYDFYQFDRTQSGSEYREPDYPVCLSIIYFENMPAFESFQKSPELTAFLKTMRPFFPGGLTVQWYVQYGLKYSLRK